MSIRKVHGPSEEGWGRLRAISTIQTTTWKTAIWFDTKAGCYLLPVKASVRKSEKIKEGDSVKVSVLLENEDELRSLRRFGRDG